MKDFKNYILGTILMVGILGTLGAATTATFTYKTPGASDTTEVVSLVYPQKVPEDASVTNAKLAEPISVANGGTGKTTAAAGLAALGGASLNGSSTVDFSGDTIAVTKRLEHTFIGASLGGQVFLEQTTLASDATLTTTLYAPAAFQEYTVGHLYLVNENNRKGAIISIIDNLVYIDRDPASGWSTVKNNAGTLNIYAENNYITIQNKTAVDQKIHGVFVGTWAD